MTMKDDELSRLRAAFAAPVPREAPRPGSCPEPDRVWEAVRGGLPAAEVREIVDHVALCASCAEDWRIAMELERRAPAVVSFPARRLQPWIAAAAAALVLTVGGVYLLEMSKPAPPAEYRGSPSKIASQTAASLPRQSFQLRWTPVEGAESYDLLVTRPDDLSTLADLKGLTAPEHRIPASALAPLPPGTQLTWQVTAVFPDGAREKSPTFRTALE